jgi:hypothetical protein
VQGFYRVGHFFDKLYPSLYAGFRFHIAFSI